MTYVMSNELYHHGILGQRWGVRRFQNPDGTLTELGKKRYGTVENFEKRKTVKQQKKEAKEHEKIVSSGKVSDVQRISNKLTDAEMEEALKRIRYEQQLQDLKLKDLSNGKEKVASIVSYGTKIKDAAQVISDAYNIGAKMYNAFNKDGKKLPIIGESKENASDAYKRFMLERDKQKFEWEKQDRAKTIISEAKSEVASEQEAPAKKSSDPVKDRASWESSNYARSAWENRTYGSKAVEKVVSSVASTPVSTISNADKTVLASEARRLLSVIGNSSLSNADRKVALDEYREIRDKTRS